MLSCSSSKIVDGPITSVKLFTLGSSESSKAIGMSTKNETIIPGEVP